MIIDVEAHLQFETGVGLALRLSRLSVINVKSKLNQAHSIQWYFTSGDFVLFWHFLRRKRLKMFLLYY